MHVAVPMHMYIFVNTMKISKSIELSFDSSFHFNEKKKISKTNRNNGFVTIIERRTNNFGGSGRRFIVLRLISELILSTGSNFKTIPSMRTKYFRLVKKELHGYFFFDVQLILLNGS